MGERRAPSDDEEGGHPAVTAVITKRTGSRYSLMPSRITMFSCECHSRPAIASPRRT